MNKKDDQFKKHQEELNQKIESIMGPTQSGEKPYDETNMPGTAPLVTQTPAKEKPETPAPKPAEVIKPDSTKTDAAVSEGPKDEE
ncbi:MAG TPA: hypothetical protein VLG71_01055, partial [Candidatus Limnocylindria bacterium]|nr:hypothetical protein [Candidatus Limnocylindria bacterium]